MRITVNVVNMLPRFQLSTQMLRHQMPMDAHSFSVYSDSLVSVFGFISGLKTKTRKLFKMYFCQARSGTIFCFFSPVRRDVIANPTAIANFVDASGVSIIRHTLLQYMLLLRSVAPKGIK